MREGIVEGNGLDLFMNKCEGWIKKDKYNFGFFNGNNWKMNGGINWNGKYR